MARDLVSESEFIDDESQTSNRAPDRSQLGANLFFLVDARPEKGWESHLGRTVFIWSFRVRRVGRAKII
jgi:hypothetical protein